MIVKKYSNQILALAQLLAWTFTYNCLINNLTLKFAVSNKLDKHMTGGLPSLSPL